MSEAPGSGENRRFTTLILAASRGPDDPVARSEAKSHKCLVDVAGSPMLERVVGALSASPSVSTMAISIEAPAVLDALPGVGRSVAAGKIRVLASAGTPSLSVLQAMATLDAYPLLITTADNPLLTPDVVEHFCAAALETGADVVAAVASEAVTRSEFPDAQRTFLRFHGGRYSGCNLFAVLNPAGLEAVRFWDEAGRHRKQPWRLVATFGVWSLVLFLLGRMTLQGALERASQIMKIRAAVVELPFPTASIDVDKPADLALVRRIFASRAA